MGAENVVLEPFSANQKRTAPHHVPFDNAGNQFSVPYVWLWPENRLKPFAIVPEKWHFEHTESTNNGSPNERTDSITGTRPFVRPSAHLSPLERIAGNSTVYATTVDGIEYEAMHKNAT